MDIKDYVIKVRRYLHKYPELGNKEFKTTEFLIRELNKFNIKTRRLTPTGVVGLICKEDKGSEAKAKTIALRADIDALPITEETNKPYASRVSGVMHACGHDANTAIVLSTGVLLAKDRERLSCNVKLIFQPNEETAGGARSLIERGVLYEPKVDVILGVHVNPEIEAGAIGIKYGEMFASVDKFEIQLIGDGGHAAMPHKSKDVISAAAKVIQEFETYRARHVDPLSPMVVSVCAIHGGERFNVLAKDVKLIGTVRTLDERLHRKVKKDMERIIKEKCALYGIKYKLTYDVIGYPLVNSERVLSRIEEILRKVLPPDKIVRVKQPSLGGEDFAEYLRYVPGAFIYVGTGNRKKRDTLYPWHHAKFDIDEDALPKAVEVLYHIIFNLL
jgi:amidohydrolase